jgi:hypothetical protein
MANDDDLVQPGVFDLLDCRSHAVGDADRGQVAGCVAVARHVHRQHR